MSQGRVLVFAPDARDLFLFAKTPHLHHMTEDQKAVWYYPVRLPARYRRAHDACVAARLAALLGFVPPEPTPQSHDSVLVQVPGPAPPPLVSARTSTAPPLRSALSHARVKVSTV
jgi:hypothetical protein